MNIFEDLIDELKEDNLLEATVVTTNKEEKSVVSESNVRDKKPLL